VSVVAARDALTSKITSEDYEPYMVEGQQVGEVHWLRQDEEPPVTLAGLWRALPGSVPDEFPYDYPGGNETLQVLEGSVVVEVAGEEPVNLGPGSIASFKQGTKSVWRLQTPFKKFFVINH
jgi:uncharacterized protein